MVHAGTTEGHNNLAIEKARAGAALHPVQSATHVGWGDVGRCRRYAGVVLRGPDHCDSRAERAKLCLLRRSESDATTMQQLQRRLLLWPHL